jgi:hypothetical protein
MGGEFERLAYETALHGLDKQEEVLRELRARTGILLAASSLTASFLGRTALEPSGSVGRVVVLGLALVAFSVSIAASIYVLMPKSPLRFSPAGSILYEQLYEFRDDLGEVYRRLAYELDRGWESNERQITRLYDVFRVAAIALGLEVLVLVIVVSGTLV